MNDRDFVTELKKSGDKICNSIFHMDLEWIDIEIQIAEMRDLCEAHRPEKLELFEMVYVSRFKRLWDTWRYSSPESWRWREAELEAW